MAQSLNQGHQESLQVESHQSEELEQSDIGISKSYWGLLQGIPQWHDVLIIDEHDWSTPFYSESDWKTPDHEDFGSEDFEYLEAIED